MPYLEIKECVSCPFHKTYSWDENHNYVGDDMFRIVCTHENQTVTEGFTAKIKNKYGNIYFPCPLENNE